MSSVKSFTVKRVQRLPANAWSQKRFKRIECGELFSVWGSRRRMLFTERVIDKLDSLREDIRRLELSTEKKLAALDALKKSLLGRSIRRQSLNPLDCKLDSHLTYRSRA